MTATSENTITSAEQVEALPAGQWVIAADDTVACLFDTHKGWAQRMWGMKRYGGTKGRVEYFTAVDRLEFPLGLADIDKDFVCPHPTANECGQCMVCGSPGIAEAEPMYFDPAGLDVIRVAAEHNSKIGATT